MLPTADVELPTVPRASNNAAGERTFCERPALVGANAVERKELALDVEERHDAIGDDEFLGAARWAIFDGGDSMPGHDSCFRKCRVARPESAKGVEQLTTPHALLRASGRATHKR